MNQWGKYVASLPLYERCLVAHGNPNNFPLIDRSVEKARMELRRSIGSIMNDAHDRVSAILNAK